MLGFGVCTAMPSLYSAGDWTQSYMLARQQEYLLSWSFSPCQCNISLRSFCCFSGIALGPLWSVFTKQTTSSYPSKLIHPDHKASQYLLVSLWLHTSSLVSQVVCLFTHSWYNFCCEEGLMGVKHLFLYFYQVGFWKKLLQLLHM